MHDMEVRSAPETSDLYQLNPRKTPSTKMVAAQVVYGVKPFEIIKTSKQIIVLMTRPKKKGDTHRLEQGSLASVWRKLYDLMLKIIAIFSIIKSICCILLGGCLGQM
jgi:hypothetical protein